MCTKDFNKNTVAFYGEIATNFIFFWLITVFADKICFLTDDQPLK